MTWSQIHRLGHVTRKSMNISKTKTKTETETLETLSRRRSSAVVGCRWVTLAFLAFPIGSRGPAHRAPPTLGGVYPPPPTRTRRCNRFPSGLRNQRARGQADPDRERPAHHGRRRPGRRRGESRHRH